MNYKINYRLGGLFLLVAMTMVSCRVKKISVQQTPHSSIVYQYQESFLLSGYPKYAKPWVVFSDTDKAPLYSNQKDEQANKKISFFEPFVVLKKRGDRYKVAKYEPGSVDNYTVDKSTAKEQGWIREEDLLLWNESLRNESTGFRLKGIVALQDKWVISNSEKYMEKDSIYVFKDPNLVHRADVKLALNTVVYFYKFTADKRRVLLGGIPQLEVDNPESKVYGWVDTDVVSLWGERTAFKMKQTPPGDTIQLGIEYKEKSTTVFNPIVHSTHVQKQNDLGHIYPLNYRPSKDDFEIHYFDNVLDYSQNRVYNVTGKPIYYEEYKAILASNRKLNLVFILEGSKEKERYLNSLNTVVQRLKMQISKQSYFNQIAFSTLFYHVDTHYKSENTHWYTEASTWSSSFEKPLFFTENSGSIITLYDSIEDLNLLLHSHENQSNVVVVFGDGLSPDDKEKQKELRDKIAQINSRFIFYQVKAKSDDTYNDFVLFAGDVVQTSAKQITNYKKQRLIHQEDVVESSEFDLSKGNQGIYQLDYPAQSMQQGAVVFPRKGEENNPFLLQQVIEKMIQDITVENQKIDSTITAVFQSDIGVSHTKVKTAYLPIYPQETSYVPLGIAKQLSQQDYPFMHTGVLHKQVSTEANDMEYGVLLDESELEQLRNYYLSIYSNVFKSKSLNNRKMIRRYIAIARKKSLTPQKSTRKFLRTNPINLGLFQSTGLYSTELDSLAHLKLNRWKRKKVVQTKSLENYFKHFKIIADQIKQLKGDKEVLLQQANVNLYWLNQAYIPVLKIDTIKNQDNSFDILPIELEQIKIDQQNKKRKGNNAEEYMKRVKQGMP
ncbi:type VI secretion system protein TssR domain-containing protein [Myroides odoratus]|uniref:type VI secretion system protein TssR domain-containing protein n=1 Tax=Myroides odoratus TaxID=256 RepID=UPI0039AFBD4F